jgi:hypothetical protein
MTQLGWLEESAWPVFLSLQPKTNAKRHNLIKSSPIELKNFAHTYFGLFGWAVAFEKGAVSCGFLKSSCEKVKSPFGSAAAAF